MIGETKVKRAGTKANIKNACGLAFIKVSKKAISVRQTALPRLPSQQLPV